MKFPTLPLRTVSIIGTGMIGASLGLALKERRLCERVIGCARTATTLNTARQLGAIDEGYRDPAEAVPEAEVVFIATPVNDIIPTFERILPHLSPPTIVTDVGSTKQQIVAGAERLLNNEVEGVSFIGGHPMAGSEKTGPAAARAGLFEGATWVLTPEAGENDEAVHSLVALVEALGARPLFLSPQEHDAIVAFTSHLPHIVACALVNTVVQAPAPHELLQRLIAAGFRDTTRLADSGHELWQQICFSNRESLHQALLAMREQLDHVMQTLEKEEAQELSGWLQEAAASRARLVSSEHSIATLKR